MKNKNWLDIENDFKKLKEIYKGKDYSDAPDILLEIASSLKKIYPNFQFDIALIDLNPNSKPYIMSVYPSRSTTDMIIESIINNKEDKVVSELWKKNKHWIIEIDSIVLKDTPELSFNEAELTALLIHEIGHVSLSNEIISRLKMILQYEVAKSNVIDKMTLRHKVFRKILSIPVLDACVHDKSNSVTNIKEEIKADKFARGNGYEKELYSALGKTYKFLKNNKNPDFNKSVGDSAAFSIQTLNDIRERRNKIAKSSLLNLIESCESPYAKNIIQDIYDDYFIEHEGLKPLERVLLMQERMDSFVEGELVNEFFSFGKSKLARIDPADFDYIIVRSQNIKKESDKMLLLGYIHSKLDIIEYYQSILNNPKLSRKYNIPHTYEELEKYKKALNDRRQFILSYKIPEKQSKFLVAWPEGYEG